MRFQYFVSFVLCRFFIQMSRTGKARILYKTNAHLGKPTNVALKCCIVIKDIFFKNKYVIRVELFKITDDFIFYYRILSNIYMIWVRDFPSVLFCSFKPETKYFSLILSSLFFYLICFLLFFYFTGRKTYLFSVFPDLNEFSFLLSLSPSFFLYEFFRIYFFSSDFHQVSLRTIDKIAFKSL